MKIFLLSLTALLLLAAASCAKKAQPSPKSDTLPPITQEGKNTFGCLVNGKVWLPGGGGQPAINPQYWKGSFGGGGQKSVYNSSNQPIIKQGVGWSIYPIYDTGKYYIKNGYAQIGTLAKVLGGDFRDDIVNHNYDVKDEDSLKNWVHISRIDSVNRIISGTFNLFFRDPGYDTIRVTDGRFDVIYTY
jgi:hypothetical protein